MTTEISAHEMKDRRQQQEQIVVDHIQCHMRNLTSILIDRHMEALKMQLVILITRSVIGTLAQHLQWDPGERDRP